MNHLVQQVSPASLNGAIALQQISKGLEEVVVGVLSNRHHLKLIQQGHCLILLVQGLQDSSLVDFLTNFLLFLLDKFLQSRRHLHLLRLANKSASTIEQTADFPLPLVLFDFFLLHDFSPSVVEFNPFSVNQNAELVVARLCSFSTVNHHSVHGVELGIILFCQFDSFHFYLLNFHLDFFDFELDLLDLGFQVGLSIFFELFAFGVIYVGKIYFFEFFSFQVRQTLSQDLS